VSSPDDIAASGLVVRPHEHVVMVQGRELDLTSREFEMVSKLVQHPGWVFSAEQLSTDNESTDYSPESVSVLMSRLRRKLERAGAPDVVETVRGVGYRLRVPPRGSQEPVSDGTHCSTLLEASWRLQEAVLEAERSGTAAQRQSAIDALDDARRAIYEALTG